MKKYFIIIKETIFFLIRYFLIKIKYGNRILCLLYTPEHSNIGDAAIAVAEKAFINKFFHGYGIFEITESNIVSNGRFFRKVLYNTIKNNKILIHGGGYLGTIWFEAGEKPLRNILSNLQHSDITIFPQTMYYENNEFGQSELENSKEIYNKNGKLKICLREKYSYEIAANSYLNTFLIPDIVFYMNESYEKKVRKGIKLCLRDDLEKTMTSEDEEKIQRFAERYFGKNVCRMDMISDSDIQPDIREKIVHNHLEKFQTSELVITDRLHGMVFAAITGTPCIVVSSKSHKVKGSYEWISHLEYIKFVENLDKIEDIYMSMNLSKKFEYDNNRLMKYYVKLSHIIQEG